MEDTTAPETDTPAPVSPWDTLSPREREVALLLATGNTNAEVAKALGISQKTVDTHRSHLMKKLELRNNVALTRYLIRAGLVTP